MSIIDAYDSSKELFMPSVFTSTMKKLPKIAIVYFKAELTNVLKNNKEFEEYSTYGMMGDNLPIFSTKVNGKEVAIYRTFVGGPITAMIMEEMISRGVEKFIFFGSCGALVSSLGSGEIFIPEKAYRDEGTSYHYAPQSDFIEVKTSAKLSKLFDKNNVKYTKVKTWTTDALYRETSDRLKKMSGEGCSVVEMECAPIMAVSNLRNVEAYQFLYTDDVLDGDEYDARTLIDDRTDMLTKCLKIALKVAEEI